jgi:hypothetical protein
VERLDVSVSGADSVHPEEVLGRFGTVVPGSNGVVGVALETGAAEVAPIVRALDEAGLAVESLELHHPSLATSSWRGRAGGSRATTTTRPSRS